MFFLSMYLLSYKLHPITTTSTKQTTEKQSRTTRPNEREKSPFSSGHFERIILRVLSPDFLPRIGEGDRRRSVWKGGHLLLLLLLLFGMFRIEHPHLDLLRATPPTWSLLLWHFRDIIGNCVHTSLDIDWLYEAVRL